MAGQEQLLPAPQLSREAMMASLQAGVQKLDNMNSQRSSATLSPTITTSAFARNVLTNMAALQRGLPLSSSSSPTRSPSLALRSSSPRDIAGGSLSRSTSSANLHHASETSRSTSGLPAAAPERMLVTSRSTSGVPPGQEGPFREAARQHFPEEPTGNRRSGSVSWNLDEQLTGTPRARSPTSQPGTASQRYPGAQPSRLGGLRSCDGRGPQPSGLRQPSGTSASQPPGSSSPAVLERLMVRSQSGLPTQGQSAPGSPTKSYGNGQLVSSPRQVIDPSPQVKTKLSNDLMGILRLA